MADLSGEWYNQHGSRVVLEIAPDGVVTGRFRSGVGLSSEHEDFRLTGFASGGLVAFVVDFGKYETLTTWAGQCCLDEDELTIRAMWHMTVAPPVAKADLIRWRGTWTGEDVFRREPTRDASKRRSMPSHPVAFFDEEW